MRIRFPQYYDLITPKGLEVYVWQTADNVYYCGLLPGTNCGATEDEITDLAANGATVEEMKVILSSMMIPMRVYLSCHAYSRLQTTLTKLMMHIFRR